VLKDLDITRSLLSEVQRMGEKYLFELIAEEGLQKGLEKGLEKGREEGLEKGREEGARDEAREAVLEVLRRRFGRVSRLLAQRLRSIEDLPTLKRLVGEAVVTPSLGAFLALLPGRRK
jgi:predicted transposase YdaD